jgi:hypothetical protein
LKGVDEERFPASRRRPGGIGRVCGYSLGSLTAHRGGWLNPPLIINNYQSAARRIVDLWRHSGREEAKWIEDIS